MFSSFIESMELFALEDVVVIDGVAYAPVEPLMYAMRDAVMQELSFIVCCILICLGLFAGVIIFCDLLRGWYKSRSESCN